MATVAESDDDLRAFLQAGAGTSSASSSPPPTDSDEALREFLTGGAPQAGDGGAPSTPSPANPASGGLSYAKHLGVLAGQGVAKGAVDTLGIPAAIDRLIREHVQPNLPAIFSAPASGTDSMELPAQNAPLVDPEGLAGRLGLESEQPSGFGENLLSAGARGLGGAVATLPLGGVAAPFTTLASGVAGGAAGESAHAAGLPPWAQFLAGVVPGLAAGGWNAAHTAAQETKAATDGLEQATGRVKDLQGQLDTARINNPSAVAGLDAQVGEAKLAAAQAVSAATSASEATRDAAKAAATTTAQNETKLADSAIEGVAGAHGQSQTLQDAGQTLQDAGREWLTKTMPAKQDAAWSPVNSAMAGSPAPLSATAAALKDINTSAGKLEPLTQLLKPGLPAQLQKVFDKTIGGGEGKESTILDESGSPVTTPATPPTWEEVQKFRSTLGDAMSNPTTIRDVGQQNLARLYSSVTQDMRNAVGQSGGDGALAAFDAANAESRRLYGIAQGPLARVIGGPTADVRFDPAPGKVAAGLLAGGKTGDRDIAALASEGLPVGELAAAQLREAPAGWSKLSPEAQATLVPDTAHRAVIDNALTLASAAPQKEKATVAAADAAHKATVATAQANADFGPTTAQARRNALSADNAEGVRDLSRSQMAAKAAQADAQARFDALPKDDHTANLLHTLQSGHVGAAAGALLGTLHQLGLDPITGGAGGEVLSRVAPLAWRGIKAAASGPAGAVPAISGGLGGLLGGGPAMQ